MRLHGLKAPEKNELIQQSGLDYLIPGNAFARDQAHQFGERFRIKDFAGIDGNSTVDRYEKQRIFSELGNNETINWNKSQDKYYNPIVGVEEEVTGEKLKAEDANKEYGLEGRLTFEDGVTRAEAQLLQSRKIEEIKYQLAYDKAKNTKGTLTLTTAFSALLDPVNIAAMFIPIVGQAYYANLIVKYGITGARIRRGAIQGAAFTTAFEIPAYAQLKSEQADYTILNSMVNVAAGTGLGSLLHVGGGWAWDKYKGVTKEQHSLAARTAIGQLADGKPVEVTPIIHSQDNNMKVKNPGTKIDTTAKKNLQ